MSEVLLFDERIRVAAAGEAPRALPLLLVGLNHRTAPVEVRERASVGETALSEAVRSLARSAGVNGACVVSTCNRTEIVLSHSSEADALEAAMTWFCERCGLPRRSLEPLLYVRRGSGVAAHLYRVASGIDSMIVGEPQVAGQVKRAFVASRDAGAIDPLLHRLYEQAMRVAKTVRTETGIGEHAVSVPYAAVELARKIFGDLKSLRVLLLGAGEVGELVAQHFAAQGSQQIFIANKTYERASGLAARFGGTALRFSAFENHLAACDIVVVSTAAPHFVVTATQIERALEARKGRSLFVLDLSLPRNVDPAAGTIAGAYLYNIDDLQQVAAANRDLRRTKVALAEEIIAREAESFGDRIAESEAVPVIVELQSHLDGIRTIELEKCLRRMGPVTAEQRESVEQLTLRMMNKVLHHAIVHLKATREPREHAWLQRTVRAIFGIE